MTCIFGGKVYEGLLCTLSAYSSDEVLSLLKLIDDDRKKKDFKFYYVGFVKYDALKEASKAFKPLAFFMLFEKESNLLSPTFNSSFAPRLSGFLDSKTYTSKIKAIKDLISQGEVYQINFTHMIKVFTLASPKDIFFTLMATQKTKYAALFDLPFMQVISLSPELFFKIDSKLEDELITTMPMKGTIKRGSTKPEDAILKNYLKNDIKNRSENVMITDLLRNDLSKVASEVKVTKLFAIHSFKSLHQMISVIEARLKLGLDEVFKALFPCGSITGAPKSASMKQIDILESTKRGLYCGAIGVVSKKETVFNVAIRTLFKDRDSKFYNYGVGGGIVWDSKAREEEKELRLKTKFLTPKLLYPTLEVFETMLYEGGSFRHLNLHMSRLFKSLDYFSVVCDRDKIFKALDSIKEEGVYKLSISLKGKVSLARREKKEPNTHKVVLSKKILDSRDDFLYHKTSKREVFARAMEKVAKGLVFDEIFLNEKGHVTQGARSNVYVLKEGIYLTPPITEGLLAGTFRASLLESKKARECILKVDNLKAASSEGKLFCSNAIYGLVNVKL
ncbi:hypothetical protein BKH43_07595 [Helicobacter sp. 13S00401-1]|uniref:chorismate-binding protein n=1 Tax=Helicobacter sp. 13S00401-1 TaxID=1905758 RepID=UPI000BA78EA4|nr:bifunctional anthranilate synthase component I family protein/class IV aminotransferase [Helicobacter sp. 13S00401-1]PAF48999.1 hypothetical protein BKH43_07595 [Helicobacter sp. 13S00401-1]